MVNFRTTYVNCLLSAWICQVNASTTRSMYNEKQHVRILCYLVYFHGFDFNPFAPIAPFLYPLKISENFTVFWCFHIFSIIFCECHLPGIYLFKANNGNTRTMCEIVSKLTIERPERRLSGDFVVNLDQISYISGISFVDFKQVNGDWGWCECG